MRRSVGLVVCFVAVGVICCGKKGPPSPPAPRGPLAPRDVEARQEGSGVRVWFLIPRPQGSKPSQIPDRAELIRVEFPPDSSPPQDPDTFRRRGHVVASLDAGSEPDPRVSLEDRNLRVLPQGGVGWILRYGVRVRDRGGRSSPLVVAQDLVAVEPPVPPSHLQAEATADGIRLKWLPPELGEGLRYNVYRRMPGERLVLRPIHPQPVENAEFLDSGVANGVTYEYVVRTAASDGAPFRESVSSEAVIVRAEDLFPPGAPEKLVVVQEGTAVRLLWNPNPERDLAGYRVYRRTADGWIHVGPDLVDHPAYLDEQVRSGQHLEYRVTAVDRATTRNESAPSDAVEVEVAQEPAPSGDTPR